MEWMVRSRKKKPYLQKSAPAGHAQLPFWRELLKYLRKAIDPNTMDTRFVYLQALIFDSVRKFRDEASS